MRDNFINMDLSGELRLLNHLGQMLPVKIEDIEFNPLKYYPRFSGIIISDQVRLIGRDKDTPIKKVIFNDSATIVIWSDNTKTVVKCQEGDTYSKELGLAMCISKKYLGNKGNFNEVFKTWIPEKTNNSYVGKCETCKYVEKGLYDKPCLDCNHNGGNKNNYKEV